MIIATIPITGENYGGQVAINTITNRVYVISDYSVNGKEQGQV